MRGTERSRTGVSRLLRACRGEPVETTPIWLMRQAGRYLPEYRALQERHGFLTLVKTPELAAEVTLQPLRRFPLDAAILFADILLPLEAMGLGLRYEPGKGPLLDRPVRERRDVERLGAPPAREALAYVLEAARTVRAALAGRSEAEGGPVPLIGFAGGPFTLASYAVEGGGSRDFRRTKALLWQEPELWAVLMDRLTAVTVDYLAAQVEAGAQALQLFDSWAGTLAPEDYRQAVLPWTRRIADAVAQMRTPEGERVPLIHFLTPSAGLLDLAAEAGGDVIGLDWRLELDWARRRLGPARPVQGNLDPLLLAEAPREVLEARVAAILRAAGPRGHVFNLGHGVDPATPPEHVAWLVEAVHRLGRREAGEAGWR
ncbi:MAG: uroporphyrinogen decarboxylase [Bacillota bacterium]|nr:uroporphyrinogen decarboxylase [Bacillota bacterium]